MELSVNERLKRAVRVTEAAPQAEKKPAGAREKTVSARPRSDRTAWSQGALAFLQELNRQDMEKRRKELDKQRNTSDPEIMSKSLEIMDKCRKIASRIMRGDKVPPQDEMFLMECDPDGYKLAIVCRQPKEHPKEWKSVLDKDERKGGSTESTGTAASGGGAAEAGDSGGEVSGDYSQGS